MKLFRLLSMIVLPAAMLPGAQSGGQTRPMATDRVAVQADLPPADAPARPASNPPAGSILHLTFPLATANRSGLFAFVQSQSDPASPNYHHWLTPEQMGQKFGAPDADVRAVTAFAASQGFKVTHVWPNHMFVSADATVANAERAFQVHIGSYLRPARIKHETDPDTFFAPDRQPSAPRSVARLVTQVSGLSDLILPVPAMHRRALRRQQPMFSGALTPADASKVYNVDGLHTLGLNGQNCTIGIFSPTNLDLSDVATFTSTYGISGYTITEVKVDGGATNSNAAIEANLDLDVVLGQAPSSNVRLYEFPNSGLFDALSQMATDKVPVVSISYGIEESGLNQTTMNDLETSMATLVGTGASVFASSGDDGAFDRATHARVTVNWPASSQFVTGVGGTGLPTDNNGAWASEVSWYSSVDGKGTGGGLSVFVTKPTYQAGPGVTNANSNGFRQVPDVAAIADPSTPGWTIYYNGGFATVGGTSAACPLWASVTRLIAQGATHSLGNLNPALYNIGTTLNDAPNIFVYHDITVGSNGLYNAASNWDYCTGWGSANFTKLYADLVQLPNLHPYKPVGTSFNGTWTSPIMIHAAAGSVAEPATFDANTSYQFAVAVSNDGPADVPSCKQGISIDGVVTKFTFGATPSGYFRYNYAALTTKLASGTHTIKLLADVDNTVKETSETDNTFTRTVQVGGTTAVAFTGISISPSVVTGGHVATVTVTLSAPAPSGGFPILLSSNSSNVGVPGAVRVPAGATTATFLATSQPVVSATSGIITGTALGVSRSIRLNLVPPAHYVLTLTPTSIKGGSNVRGTITLAAPAPTGGLQFVLSSDSTSATLASGVTIGAGGTVVTFTITTHAVTAAATANITATLGSAFHTVALGITP